MTRAAVQTKSATRSPRPQGRGSKSPAGLLAASDFSRGHDWTPRWLCSRYDDLKMAQLGGITFLFDPGYLQTWLPRRSAARISTVPALNDLRVESRLPPGRVRTQNQKLALARTQTARPAPKTVGIHGKRDTGDAPAREEGHSINIPVPAEYVAHVGGNHEGR